MILTSTRDAEVARLDQELASLSRAGEAALASADRELAGALFLEIRRLQIRREELTGSPGLWDTHE